MSEPQTLYNAAITYRTPSGRAVRFMKVIAAYDLHGCEHGIRDALRIEGQYGRRKVETIVGHFSAIPFSTQGANP